MFATSVMLVLVFLQALQIALHGFAAVSGVVEGEYTTLGWPYDLGASGSHALGRHGGGKRRWGSSFFVNGCRFGFHFSC